MGGRGGDKIEEQTCAANEEGWASQGPSQGSVMGAGVEAMLAVWRELTVFRGRCLDSVLRTSWGAEGTAEAPTGAWGCPERPPEGSGT